jgi:hypothetical protein
MPGFPPIARDGSIGEPGPIEIAMDLLSVAIGGAPPDQRVEWGAGATFNLDVIVAADPMGELSDVIGDLEISVALEPWKRGGPNYVQPRALTVDGANLRPDMPTDWVLAPQGYALTAADYGGDYIGCHLYRAALSIATDDPDLPVGEEEDYSVHISIKKGTLAYKGGPYDPDTQAWNDGPVLTIYRP